jgi:hypothetical protein
VVVESRKSKEKERRMITRLCLTLLSATAVVQTDAFSLTGVSALSRSLLSPQQSLLQFSTESSPQGVLASTMPPRAPKTYVDARWQRIEAVEQTKSLPAAKPPRLVPALPSKPIVEKPVVVTIQYSENAGLRPYFLTVAKKVKLAHPDVTIERRILPAVDPRNGENMSAEATFEVLVNGKIVVGKDGRGRSTKVARVDMKESRSIFVSMHELDLSISRARRKKRPSASLYGLVESSNNSEYGGGAAAAAYGSSGADGVPMRSARTWTGDKQQAMSQTAHHNQQQQQGPKWRD